MKKLRHPSLPFNEAMDVVTKKDFESPAFKKMMEAYENYGRWSQVWEKAFETEWLKHHTKGKSVSATCAKMPPVDFKIK